MFVLSPAPSLPPPATLLDLSGKLAGILGNLRRGIALWSCRERPTPLTMLANNRAGRLVRHVQAILALLAAGRLPRVRKPRTPTPQTPTPQTSAPQTPAPRPATELTQATELTEAPEAAPDAPPPLPKPGARLPQRFGWMLAKGIEIRWAGGNLRHWLTDPAIQAVLAEVPQARRPLAALGRMLGIPPWPYPPYGEPPPPKPRVRKPRPKKPQRPTAAEERAFLYRHRCIETDIGMRSPTARPWWFPPKRWRKRWA